MRDCLFAAVCFQSHEPVFGFTSAGLCAYESSPAFLFVFSLVCLCQNATQIIPRAYAITESRIIDVERRYSRKGRGAYTVSPGITGVSLCFD
ncbi:hypothetical protein QQF64_003333 [Cirrhinus molitorella]|uniref:Secreted protein n=1 Tax=Cirrhinus molitorella TaxID=172907 RepID=A0ABR3ML06_9TELE